MNCPLLQRSPWYCTQFLTDFLSEMTGKLCTFSTFEFWRLRTNSRTARRQFSTGVNSVPGFSKNHTVTNAIFVDADCSASERSPARRVIHFPLQAWAKSSLSTHLVNREACNTANFNHIFKHGHVNQCLYWTSIEWDFVIYGIIKGLGVTSRAKGWGW